MNGRWSAGLIAVVVVALVGCVTPTSPAAGQTLDLPSPSLPPPEAPPRPAPPTPPAPSPPPAPSAPTRAPTPSAGPAPDQPAAPARPTPVTPSVDQPTEAQRAAAARRAAEALRLKRDREVGRTKRRVITAIRSASGPLPGYATRVVAPESPAPVVPGRRSEAWADYALVGIAMILASLVAFLAWRRRRARPRDARGAGLSSMRLPEGAGVMALIALGAALTGWVLSRPGDARLAILACLLAGIAGLGALSSRMLVPTLIIWFATLGLIRRLLTEFVEPTRFDLLLLVGPSILVALVVGSRSGRRATGPSTLTNLVAGLGFLTVVAAVNPLNDSIAAGMAGLLFVLVPILAYWIGMRIGDSCLRSSLYLVGGLSLLTSFYGLYQTFGSFPSWDRHWIENAGYDALNVGGEIRAFSSFSSASEYAAYTSIGLTIVVAIMLLAPKALPVTLPLLAFLGTALFFESARGAIFRTVAAIGLMLAARHGMKLMSAAAIAVAFVLLVPVAVSRIAPERSDNSLVAHQVSGLADPTDAQNSTLVLHASIVGDALRQTLIDPLGSGLSKVTIAGGRLGGAETEAGGGAAGAESDIETVAVAMGMPGLLVFVAIFGLGIARLYGLARSEPGFLTLAALGILAVTALQWLNGGQYAVGLLPWLVLGWGEARHLARHTEASRGGQRVPEAGRAASPSRERLLARR